jgi:hypothetical protein
LTKNQKIVSSRIGGASKVPEFSKHNILEFEDIFGQASLFHQSEQEIFIQIEGISRSCIFAFFVS